MNWSDSLDILVHGATYKAFAWRRRWQYDFIQYLEAAGFHDRNVRNMSISDRDMLWEMFDNEK